MRILGAFVVLALLAGCASTTPAATPKPTTYPKQDANAIAALIEGCSDIQSEDIVGGAKSGMASAASCTLNGHKVYVDSYEYEAATFISGVFRREGYYASGLAWTVILGDDPTIQYQVTNDAGALTKQSFAGHQAAANVDAEKSISEVAAASLGGKVVHVAP